MGPRQREGERDGRLTSVFGPYVDQLLIPQMKELADDTTSMACGSTASAGPSITTTPSPSLKAFQEQTGIQSVPRTRADPGWYEFSEFCREGFRRYLRRYVDEVHRHDSGFQIASNWAFSSMHAREGDHRRRLHLG